MTNTLTCAVKLLMYVYTSISTITMYFIIPLNTLLPVQHTHFNPLTCKRQKTAFVFCKCASL